MLKEVDNFELLGKALFPAGECADGEFYFVQILVRGKDGNRVTGNNKNRLVRFYVVRSAEKLAEIKTEVKDLCFLHNARAYIHPTPRSDKEVSAVMLEDAVHEFTTGNYHAFRKLYSTACGKSFVAGKKLYIIDLDTIEGEDMRGYIARTAGVVRALVECRGKDGVGADKVVVTVPTKSGTHIVARPFDVGQFESILKERELPVPDIHKNNPTLLFCYKEDE